MATSTTDLAYRKCLALFNNPALDGLFCDPISSKLMTDPVEAKCGHIFERKQIVGWIRENATDATPPSCPLCIGTVGILVECVVVQCALEVLQGHPTLLDSDRYAMIEAAIKRIQEQRSKDEKNGSPLRLEPPRDYTVIDPKTQPSVFHRTIDQIRRDFFGDPISSKLMTDPVEAQCGHVFERRQLLDWLKRKATTQKISICPLCNSKLGSLIDCKIIKTALEILEKHSKETLFSALSLHDRSSLSEAMKRIGDRREKDIRNRIPLRLDPLHDYTSKTKEEDLPTPSP